MRHLKREAGTVMSESNPPIPQPGGPPSPMPPAPVNVPPTDIPPANVPETPPQAKD